jgi:hypothetical protein
MAEIYVNSNSPIRTKIYWEGELASPTGNVTAKVYDITQNPANVISSTNLLLTLTGTAVETDVGTYQVVLPFSYSAYPRKLKIVWEYVVTGSTVGTHTTYVNVVTPYISINEQIDELNFGSDPSDPNYKTYSDLQMAERYARKLIEEYTQQEFYLYPDTKIIYGDESDTLPLSSKLNRIYQIYSNDILLVDNLSTPKVNNWLYDPIVSETGFGIRVNRVNLLDNSVYVANGLVPPTINDTYNGVFSKNVKYKIVGEFGWDLVPAQVQLATVELMKDYFSKDKVWRNKYIKSIKTFDWSFEYNSSASKGTGNLYADQLLAPHVISQMVLI